MKIAFVAGFFEPVKKALEHHYPNQLKNGSIIWIRQQGINLEANLTDFSARLNARTKHGPVEILMLLAVPRKRQFVLNAVEGILQTACTGGESTYKVVPLQDLGNSNAVLDELDGFELPMQSQIDSDAIRKKINHGKILCVSLAGKTSIFSALRRAGFSEAAIAECFEETVLDGARHSDANGYFASKAASHTCFLYAWDGLRTTSPATKTAFKFGCTEAPTARAVADMFKKRILDD